MTTDYPGSIDSFADPITSDPLNNPSHAGQHTDKNDAIVAIENKIGTDASTPTDGTVLKGTGAGNSSWEQVESDDIADDAVETAKIEDDAVTPPKAGDLSQCVNVDNNGTPAVVTDQLIQRGWGFITGDDTDGTPGTITLPVAFDDDDFDFTIAVMGFKSGSDPTGRSDSTRAGNLLIGGAITNSNTVEVIVFDRASGNIVSSLRVLFSWIAIGTKAR